MVWGKKTILQAFNQSLWIQIPRMKNATAVGQTREANVVRDIVFSFSTSIEDMTSHHKTTHTCC